MKIREIVFSLFVAALVGSSTPAQASKRKSRTIPWLTNYEKAVQIAQATSKPILLFFTGSDWCGWCNKLEREVFEKGEFSTAISDQLIFVKLDYPVHTSQDQQITNQNEQLQKKFSVRSFPTVIILDSDQQPIGTTGWRAGNGKQYAQHLMRMVNDYSAYKEQMAWLATSNVSGKELKRLYEKAQEFGLKSDCCLLMEKGLYSNQAPFFLTESYRRLVKAGKVHDEETLSLKQRLFSVDPDNLLLTHYQVAVIDFESLCSEMEKNDFSPEKTVAPLVDYINKFGHQDKENLWRLNMVVSQVYLDKNQMNQALKYAKDSYLAAPSTIQPDIAKAIKNIQKQMQLKGTLN
ncbi:MAG: thioredoxin family protein [Waddliaceae bacterium]